MEKFELPLAVLADAIGQPIETVQSLFLDTEATPTEGEEKVWLTGEKAAEKFRGILASEQDRLIKVGIRKKGEEFDNVLRGEFGITDKTQGEALVKKAAQSAKAASEKWEAENKAMQSRLAELQAQLEKGANLEGKDLEKFVVNTEIYSGKVAQLEAEKAAIEKRLQETVRGYERKDMEKQLHSKILDAFNEYSPNIAGSPEKVASQKALFVKNVMNSADWRTEGEKLIPYDKGTGDRATNRAQVYVDLTGFVYDMASSMFDRHAGDPSKSAPGAGGVNGKPYMPDFRGKHPNEVFAILETFRGKATEEEVREAAEAYVSAWQG